MKPIGKQSLVIGTSNPAKYDQLKMALFGCGIHLQSLLDFSFEDMPVENNLSIEKNALKKAAFYFHKLHRPVLTMDGALYFNGIATELQPGLRVRRILGLNKKATDYEVLQHYQTLIEKSGGRLNGYFEYGICIMLSSSQFYIKKVTSHRLFISPPSKTMVSGFPLSSLQFDTQSGKFLSEMNKREEKGFWHRTLGKYMSEFVMQAVSPL
ncbi:hypothetical protein HY948_05235 [Candidatus Gottesmanbacteria bacterium]|nr:hypothetical protein [Candidatus Gottesmanbacteria bacterium]